MSSADDFQGRLRALQQDRVHGASELAREALRILADVALHAAAEDVIQMRVLLGDRAGALAGARPSMAPLHNLLGRWQRGLADLKHDDLDRFRSRAAEAAMALVSASERAVVEAAGHARDGLAESRTLITHSLSSTVSETLRRLKGRGLRVIATESRPLNEGYALAERLSAWGISTRLITDAQLGFFAKQADAALVGADSLLPDGAVLNKAGTYLLALAARDADVPFYVCCESFKLRTPEMGEPELEEMDPAELSGPDLARVEIRNLYFDITPSRLISAWITERGVTRQWTGRL